MLMNVNRLRLLARLLLLHRLLARLLLLHRLLLLVSEPRALAESCQQVGILLGLRLVPRARAETHLQLRHMRVRARLEQRARPLSLLLSRSLPFSLFLATSGPSSVSSSFCFFLSASIQLSKVGPSAASAGGAVEGGCPPCRQPEPSPEPPTIQPANHFSVISELLFGADLPPFTARVRYPTGGGAAATSRCRARLVRYYFNQRSGLYCNKVIGDVVFIFSFLLPARCHVVTGSIDLLELS